MRSRIPKMRPMKRMSFKRAIIEHVAELQKEINKLNCDLRRICQEEADKAIESKIPTIEGRLALKEANLVKRILIEKGIIDEKEYIERFRSGK